MKWSPVVSLAVLSPVVCHASVYMTTEQAIAVMLPGASVTLVSVPLSRDQQKQLKKISGIYSSFKANQIYKSTAGEWLIIDKVLGKHELITYAVTLTRTGQVKQVEILEYNESYGGQVRNASWRSQFVNKGAADALTVNQDISNISGATLSTVHVTNGVKRIVNLYHFVLKGL